MKRRFLQAVFLLVSAASSYGVSAYPAPVGIIVKTYLHQPFTVMLDRQRVATRVNSFQMDGLTAGRHHVRIVEDNYRYASVRANVLYDGWIELHPYETVTLNIERSGVYFSSAAAALPSHCEMPYHSYDTYYEHNYQPQPLICAMSPGQFQMLKQTVISRSFDSTKRELLQSALQNNYVTSQQLYELVSLMDFESSRLEVAKLGYAKVIDKENFYTVYNAFTFDSSIRELNKFIG
jgi:hypothetical protein